MLTLSITFNIELTDLRLETYWNALKRYSIDAIEWACQQAINEEPHFPVPLTLRAYAKTYLGEQRERVKAQDARQVAQWSATPDEEGVAAIRNIRRMLGDAMQMPQPHPAYATPSTVDPAVRRAELLRQAQQVMRETSTTQEDPDDATL